MSAVEQRQSHIHFLECMDRINRVIHNSDDVEQMLWKALETAFAIFECDRIWLFYPCDPQALSYRIPVEITRPEFPGAHALNLDVPMKPGGDAFCAKALASEAPVLYGPKTDPPIFAELTEQFGVRSQMAMAITPRIGAPWMLGMHQCSYAREWTDGEQRLFEGIAMRIGEGLSTLLLLRDLRESQERFDLAVQGARDGLWDWPDTTIPAMWWAPRVFEILGFSPDEIIPSESLFYEMVHEDDRLRVRQALRAHLHGGSEPYDVEYRVRSRSGRYLWVHGRGESLRNQAGQSRRMSGSIQDTNEYMGFWALGLSLKDIQSFAEGLTHDAHFIYAKGTNKFRDDYTGKSVHYGRMLTDKDSLVEIDFNTGYKLYDELTLSLDLGYLNLSTKESRWNNVSGYKGGDAGECKPRPFSYARFRLDF